MSGTNGERVQGQAILSLEVEDRPGVMMKVVSLFARRGFNIAGISASACEKKGISRIIIKVEGHSDVVEQIYKQMNKLVEVIKVRHVTKQNSTIREMALIKVGTPDDASRQKVISLVDIFKGKVVDVSMHHLTIQIAGKVEKIDGFAEIMKEDGLLKEIARSGEVALPSGKGTIHTE